MPAHKAFPIELSFEHERELNALVRAHSTPQQLAERARIILLAASGLGVEETANELGSGARRPAPGGAVGETRMPPPAWPRV